MPVQTTTLTPGDILFIPHRWWHLIDSAPGRNLAYTFQWAFPKRVAGRPNKHFSYQTLEHILAFRTLASAIPPALQPCLKDTDTASAGSRGSATRLSDVALTSDSISCLL